MSQSEGEGPGRSWTAEDWKGLANWLLDDDIDAGVTRVLGWLGRRHGADRVWVIRYDGPFTLLWNTHEWVAPGVRPQMAELQNIPVEAGQWMHEGLLRDGRLLVEDVAAMPRRARGLQVEFQRQGIRSLLSLPVLRDDRLAFQIGYDAVRAAKVWSEREISELGDVAPLVARALWHREGSDGSSFPPPAPENRVIHLRNGTESWAVAVSDIVWIEAAGDYTVVHTAGRQRLTERRSVKAWEGILPRADFLRIHRGAIVRTAAIQRLDRRGGRWRLTLAPDGPELSVGRAYHAAVRRRLGH